MVVEKILGFEDAINEYDDHDREDHNKKRNIKIDLLDHVAKTYNYAYNQLIEGEKLFPDYDAQLTSGFSEIDSPPPKV